MPSIARSKKPAFLDAGKILEKIRLVVMPIMGLAKFPTLEKFFPQFGISGVGSISPENIELLMASFDQHLLLEKGSFILLDKFQDVGKVDENDELRIVGLLVNGQWLVVKIYPGKITKFPSKNIKLRDCFDVVRISEGALSERDCSDILFVNEDVDKIVAMFHLQIDDILRQVMKDLGVLQKCEEQMRNILLKKT